jgi:NosR/NirI family nitrous oxide reductase transcriptional regulator
MRTLSHNRKLVLIVLLFVVFIALPLMAQNQFRFPRPDFKSDYQIPEATQPEAGGTILLYSSVILLVLCTALASWLALRARSRSGILALCIFSIVFFGFVRKGCVCPVGSLQNVSLALFSPYAIPITAAIFFVIPLLFTLVFGRTFCAAVCPLGAVQDVVIVKPLSLPRWLRHVLSILPCIYLALAVLLAATGTDFIICRFDPFVGFFRIGAELHMIFAGAMFLVIGTVIARPYCRFLCPYGVLLNFMSRFSKHHLTITPDECIECRLCEDSCPFDAITKPTSQRSNEPTKTGARRLAILLLLLPLFAVGGGALGAITHTGLSELNTTVSFARQLAQADPSEREILVLEEPAFGQSQKSAEDILEAAAQIEKRFQTGSILLGIFLGLCIGGKLLRLSTRRSQKGFSPDRGECFSCGRCIQFCPVHKDKTKTGPINDPSIQV